MREETFAKLKLRSCSGKSWFTKEEADQKIEGFAEKNILMFYYLCEFCKRYHLTSSPPVEDLNKNIQKAMIDKFNEIPTPFLGLHYKRKKKRRYDDHSNC